MSMTFAAVNCDPDDPCSAKILNNLSPCHLGVRLCLCTFEIEALTSILEMTKIRQRRKINFSACFFDHLLLVPDFCQLPCRYFLKFFPIIFPLLPLHSVFQMLDASDSFCSDVIFVIPVRYSFESYSHSFVGINNTSILGLVFPNIAASCPAAIYWCFTRHCCWHRNFQHLTSVFSWCV